MFSSLTLEFCELKDVFVWVFILSFVKTFFFHYYLVSFVVFVFWFAFAPWCAFLFIVVFATFHLVIYCLSACHCLHVSCLCTLLPPLHLLLLSHLAPCCYLRTSHLTTTFIFIATFIASCLVVAFMPYYLCAMCLALPFQVPILRPPFTPPPPWCPLFVTSLPCCCLCTLLPCALCVTKYSFPKKIMQVEEFGTWMNKHPLTKLR